MAEFTRKATLEWSGDVMHGAGTIRAGTGAFVAGASFPRLGGDPPDVTTPEEALAAAHAICYGIGLRSVIGRRGGTARRVSVTAKITAEKGSRGIRIKGSHLSAIVEGLEGIERRELPEIAETTRQDCTISIAIRDAVAVTYDIDAIE